MSERHCAGQILEYLLALESESSGYDQERILEKLVGLLHDPTNGEKLERVRRGIGFAIRIKGALDQAGFRRGSSLRLID